MRLVPLVMVPLLLALAIAPPAAAGTTCVTSTSPQALACLCVDLDGCGKWDAWACDSLIRVWTHTWVQANALCADELNIYCMDDPVFNHVCGALVRARDIANDVLIG